MYPVPVMGSFGPLFFPYIAREQTAQNARSFKMSDRCERLANSFFLLTISRLSTLFFFHSENQRSLINFERILNL
jgi:putative SOS response-associated peptidase YedK